MVAAYAGDPVWPDKKASNKVSVLEFCNSPHSYCCIRSDCISSSTRSCSNPTTAESPSYRWLGKSCKYASSKVSARILTGQAWS